MARPLVRRAVVALTIAAASPLLAGAQLIQIKTLPIAEGDQWRIFPSANSGLGDVSIALADSLLDPFINPAKTARVPAASGGAFFGAPLFYSVSEHAGGGQTLPAGTILRSGRSFAALALAFQEITAPRTITNFAFPGGLLNAQGAPIDPPTPSRQNQFAFASAGRTFANGNLSLAGAVQWAGLHDIDGTDQLYAGSLGVEQHGNEIGARLGLTRDWVVANGTRTLEAMVLHDQFSMTHDVTFADQMWDPNTRLFTQVGRVDHNLDRTRTWGLHLGYTQPVADSGWRIGTIATANLMTHPKLPDYQIARVAVIPWDPGHSAAYDLGLGVSKVYGPTTFGLDAIYEPIRTHTWGEANSDLTAASGATIPVGGKTTENHFKFSNAILRTGVGHDIPLGTAQTLRLQLGIDLRAIDYRLDQMDHVTEVARSQRERWNEWTRTWGLGLHFSDMEIRYAGRRTTGTGRPGVVQSGVILNAPVGFADLAGANVLAAPDGPLTLTDVTVTTHQISVSLPIH